MTGNGATSGRPPPSRREPAPGRRRSAPERHGRPAQSPAVQLLARLRARHGWRLYAAPLLLVVTAFALLSGRLGPGSRSTAVGAPLSTSGAPSATTVAGPVGATASSSAPSAPSATTSPPAATSPAASTPTTSVPTTTRPATHAPKPTPSSAPPSAVNPKYGQLIAVAPGKGSTVCAHNTRAQRSFISLADQHAWFCEKSHLIRDTVVTTGASTEHHATPVGSWLVQAKQADRVLNGPGYSQHVRYWVPFDGDFGFHDSAWQKMPYGTTGYRTLGSHGCVHLPRDEMTWFYHWVHVGAGVTITK